MIVRLSRRALSDLDTIYAWIAADDPVRAASFVAELIERADRIGNFPFAYPVLARRRRRIWRRCVHGNYRIVYEVIRRRVEIIAIIHGARDLDALL